MDKLADLSMGMNFDVMKEPRGFIKVLEFILAIFAFATTTAHNSHSEFTASCNNTGKAKTYRIDFSYPFKLQSDSVFNTPCDDTPQSPCCNFNSAPEFYVFVGVMAFLYSLAAIVLYIKFDRMYREKDLIPIIDFFVTIAFAVLFFIASTAWADGLSKVKYNVDPSTLFATGHVPYCKGNNDCTVTYTGNFAGLNVSIMFGYLCMGVWASNLWFLYKETKWFQDKEVPAEPQQSTPQFSTPTVPSPDQGQI